MAEFGGQLKSGGDAVVKAGEVAEYLQGGGAQKRRCGGKSCTARPKLGTLDQCLGQHR